MAKINVNYLKKIANDVRNNNSLSEKQMRIILEREGRRLMGYLQDEILDFYHSYDPVIYKRTYRFLNSLRIEPVKKFGNVLSIKIYFDDDYATHPSIMGDMDGWLPKLLNDGYSWRQETVDKYLGGKHREYFSRRDGFDFLEKAVKKYNINNPYGFMIEIKLNWDGQGE